MNLAELWDHLKQETMGLVGVGLLLFFIFVAVFAPWLAPYDPFETNYRADGSLARMDPPSSSHWFGTTRLGRDVFSQVIMGSRVAVITGLSCAIVVATVGTVMGLTAGYYGGRVDDILMRLADIAYGVPFLPFGIILVAILGPSLRNIIIAIVAISWRTTSRVVRSEVLSLRSRAFIEAARVSGASDLRIIFHHLAPNVLPITLVYTALAMGWAIMTEASLSFLGYGDPMLWSWGKILFSSYVAQAMNVAWWWVVPPGLFIALFTMSGFLISRSVEEIVNPRLRRL